MNPQQACTLQSAVSALSGGRAISYFLSVDLPKAFGFSMVSFLYTQQCVNQSQQLFYSKPPQF
jgi:hypothetical protein